MNKRLDELPFSAYHWLLVFSLGITWMLDGLEMTVKNNTFVTIQNVRKKFSLKFQCTLCGGVSQVVSVVSAQLKREDTLALTDFQVGLAGSAYLTGRGLTVEMVLLQHLPNDCILENNYSLLKVFSHILLTCL